MSGKGLSPVPNPAALQSTHWEGCWGVHQGCAIDCIGMLVRTLREIDRAAQEYAPMGTIKVLASSALVHFPDGDA